MIRRLFRPRESLTDDERRQSMRDMTLQAVAASGADGLASGGFLTAFALILGASTVHIGIMTAIPFIVQPIQLLAVIAVERMRVRKPIAVGAYLAAYATWIPIALIPFAIETPNPGAVTLLLLFIAVRGAANAFVATSWSGWIRDLVPQGAMGSFFATRLRAATVAAAVTGLGAAFYIDWWKGAVPESDVIYGYSYAILLGSIALGFSAVGFMARMPEPRMVLPEGGRPSVVQSLAAPMRDANFRQLIKFLFAWSFVVQLAVPFFAVYMLTILELSLSVVVGLGVLSQLTNVLFIRVWGVFDDRFGAKAILSICSSLYLLVILCWTFTTMPDQHALTMPLLIVLHALLGIAGAGISISSTTIRMKMAPQAQATSFLTGASLAANLGAGIGPLLGGAFVEFFSSRHFEIGIEWVDPARTVQFPAVFLTGYDFLFAVAFILGLFTLGMLSRIREDGEADRSAVMGELAAQTRENLRSLSAVPGVGLMARVPVTGQRFLPPIPGLDVAASVTAYQLASSVSAAVTAAARGGAAARQVQSNVNQVAARVLQETESAGRLTAAVAFGGAQGAVQAARGAGASAGQLIHDSMIGLLGAVSEVATDPLEAVRGSVHGAIQGAGDAGISQSNAATQAIQAARDAATELGITEEQAVATAARAAMEAADDLTSEAQAQVREAAFRALMREKS